MRGRDLWYRGLRRAGAARGLTRIRDLRKIGSERVDVRTVVGVILILVGGAIVLAGIGLALWPLIAAYQQNMANPMGDGATAAETDLQSKMLRGVYVGVPGLIVMIAGKMMVKAAIIRKLRSKGR